MSSSRETHFVTCPLCEATCGLAVEVEAAAVVRIRGDRDDVFSKGFLCPKGSVLDHLHTDPDRLRTPMVRRNGVLEPSSWEEAYALIAERLGTIRAEHGPGSTGVYVGNPNAHGPCIFHIGALLAALGSPHFYSAASVDQLPREIANGYLYGDPRAWPVPDIDRTDLLVMLGANPVVSGGSLATAPDWPRRIDGIRARGGRVVVIDPRRTETADRAGEWISIRPGSDPYLLAAIAQVIFEDDLVDLGTVGHLIDGVEALPSALADFTPESVAQRTGIGAEDIRRLAHDIAAAPSAAVYGRVGLQTQRFGTLASWLTDVIATCTGNLDRPGGTMFATPAAVLPVPDDYPGGFVTGRWHSRVSGHPECRGELPVAALPEEILTPGDGQLRGFICLAGNPVSSCPDTAAMEEAFAALEFLVCVDMYINETSRYADVILPPPSQLQRVQHDIFFYPMAVRNTVHHSRPVLPADSPNEEDIIATIAAVLAGLPPDAAGVIHDLILGGVLALVAAEESPERLVELSGDTAYERVLDLLFRTGPYGAGFTGSPGLGADRADGGLSLEVLLNHPHGIDLGPLQPSLPDRLRTPGKRINLAPPVLIGDLDRLRSNAEPSTDLILIGRRQLRSNNSWMHNIRVLAKGKFRCTLHMHPDDAAVRGLATGDTATVTSMAGAVDALVEVTDTISLGVVSLPHGWGHGLDGMHLAVAAQRPGVNVNTLTDRNDLDPLSGTCSINAIPVSVRPRNS